MGSKTGISPVFMLLSVYAGVKLFGISGIIKGPLAMVVLLEIWKCLWNKDSGGGSFSCEKSEKKL